MSRPKFKSEAEEADWYYKNRNKIKWGKPIRDKNGKLMTPEEIIKDLNTSKAISIRLPVSDIELAKQQAADKGIGYQTWIRMLLREGLRAAAPQQRQRKSV